MLGERFFDLGGEFEGEVVQALRQIANVLQEVVIGDEGRNGGEKASGGGDEGFGDSRSNGAEAGSAGGAEAGEGVNDAPNGAKEADERSDSGGGGQPGHPFFDAANFFGRSELHGDRDGLEALELLRRGIAGAGDLRLKFAVTSGIDVGKGRARGNQALWIGDAFGGPEDSEELIAFAANASEDAELLENERPGDQREEEKQQKDETSDPAGLRENVEDVADEDGGEQENGVSPSRKRKFYRQKQRNTGVEHGQKNIDAGSVGRVRRGRGRKSGGKPPHSKMGVW